MKKRKRKPISKPRKEICVHCKKGFEMNWLEGWTMVIRHWKPACSTKCNKALGQIF